MHRLDLSSPIIHGAGILLLSLLAWVLLVPWLNLPSGWVLVGIIAVDLVFYCVVVLPRFFVRHRTIPTKGVSAKEQLELRDAGLRLQNEVRSALLQGLAGGALLVGLFFSWHQLQLNQDELQETNKQVAEQLKVSREQLKITRDQQISERFSRAVDQLGAETTEAKLGAITTLEEVALTPSPESRPMFPRLESAVAYIAGFLRSVSRIPADEIPKDWAREDSLDFAKPELQAAIDTLSRLNKARDNSTDASLALTHVYLIQAQLQRAYLVGADLEGARLQGADLTDGNLQRANLRNADLRGANLTDADLEGASLQQAVVDQDTVLPEGFAVASADLNRVPTTTPTTPRQSSPTIEIRHPESGNARQEIPLVEGRYAGLPTDGSIWLLVRPHAVPAYYPQERCQIVDDKTWECGPISVGQPQERGQFDIIAVIANSKADARLRNYLDEAVASNDYRGIGGLPQGVLSRDQIIVRR